MIYTSQRKKSECCLSDALFTNSLNGRVLWGQEVEVRPRTDKRFHNECDRPSSLVRKVFAQEVHLRHRGHMDLDFLVPSLLPEVFHRPLLQAGSQPHTSQNRRSALECQDMRTYTTENSVRVMWPSDCKTIQNVCICFWETFRPSMIWGRLSYWQLASNADIYKVTNVCYLWINVSEEYLLVHVSKYRHVLFFLQLHCTLLSGSNSSVAPM